jgi:hypothetical protein
MERRHPLIGTHGIDLGTPPPANHPSLFGAQKKKCIIDKVFSRSFKHHFEMCLWCLSSSTFAQSNVVEAL